MTPERREQLQKLFTKKYPTQSELLDIREGAIEILQEFGGCAPMMCPAIDENGITCTESLEITKRKLGEAEETIVALRKVMSEAKKSLYRIRGYLPDLAEEADANEEELEDELRELKSTINKIEALES